MPISLKKSCVITFVWAVLNACLVLGAHAGDNIKLLTEDFPPLSYLAAGRPTGVSVEIVRAVIAKLGEPDTIEIVSWNRAINLTTSQAGYAVFSTGRTSEREANFKWVGPLVENDVVLVARKSAGLAGRSPEQLRSLYVGLTANSPFVERMTKEGYTGLDLVTDASANPRKLAVGRIDLWMTNLWTMPLRARDAGIDPADLEPVQVYDRQSLYLAFGPATSDAVIARWQGALDDLRRDGSLDRIIESYRKTAGNN
jgi:polar amino acid transport system substrate-binding protein